MDYLLDKLIRETTRFLELCQKQVLDDRISVKTYKALTSTKFEFIDNILDNEKGSLFVDISLKKKLDTLFINDNYLCNSVKKTVCK